MPRKPRERKIIVNFTISKSVIWELREIKDNHGINMSEVVEILIVEYLKRKKLARYNVNMRKVAEITDNILQERQNTQL